MYLSKSASLVVFTLLFSCSLLFAQSPLIEQAFVGERVAPTVPTTRVVTSSPLSAVPCVITVMAAVTDLTCGGDMTGQVVLSSPDWTLPLATIDWSDDTYDGMMTVMGIAAGMYMVTVTDANGCVGSVNFTVNSPPLLEVTMCLADFSDEGSGLGFLQFFATGGTGNYDLTLTGPTTITDASTPGDPNNPNTTYFVPITTCILPGDYTISVEDENGCMASCGPVSFQPNCLISASAVVTQPDCVGTGGDIAVTASDAYCTTSYSWSGGLSGDHPANIPDGSYSVTVSDFYGCQTVLGPFVIATPTPAALSCTPQTTSGPGANDGTIDLDIMGGQAPYGVVWSGQTMGSFTTNSTTPQIGGLPPGNYTVTVVDNLGCSSMCMVTVTVPPCILDISCANVNPTMAGGNGGVDITVIDGFPPYNVFYFGPDNGSSGNNPGPLISITDLPPGSYNVQVTDALNCSVTCQVVITGIDCSSFTVDSMSSVATCGSANSGTIDLTPNGGVGPYVFDWTLDSLDGIEDPFDLPSGVYSVIVMDAQGCSVGPLDFDLQGNPPLVLDCMPSDVTMNGGMDGSITIGLSGGTGPFGLLWTTATASDSIANVSDGFVLNNLTADDYTLLITDQNGCTVFCMATINEPTCTLSLMGMSSDPVCAGDSSGSISLMVTNVTGVLVIDWDDDDYDGQTNLTNVPAGTYTVTVMDDSGCTPAPQTFTLTDPAPLSLSCFGNEIDDPAAGVDSLVVEVMNGTAPYTITYTGPMSDTQMGLLQDSIILMVPAGDYNITVTDANGCVDSCMATIDPPSCAGLGFTLAATDNVCADDELGDITLTMTGGFDPFTFVWSDPSLNGMQNPTGLSAGWYIVTVTDLANCMLIDSIEIMAPPAIMLNCAATDETTSGGLDGMIDVSFGGGVGPYAISGDLAAAGLNAVDSPFNFNGLSPGLYNLVLTDANGCQDSCMARVNPGGCNINLDFTLIQPDCASPTGSATVTVLDAQAPFIFDWNIDSLDGMSSVTNLTPGEYFIQVTDDLTCVVDSSFIIIPFVDFPELSVDTPAVVCFDECVVYNLNFVGTGPFELTYNYDLPVVGTGTDMINIPGNSGQLQLCPADFGVESLEGMSIDFVQLTDAICSTDTTVIALPQVFPLATDTIRGLACADSVLVIGGSTFNAAMPMGEEILIDASSNGCDSLVVVDLTFLPPSTGQLDTTICATDNLNFNGEIFDATRPMGDVVLSDASVNGCDSTVTVNLSFFPAATGQLDTTICATGTVDFNGEIFDATRPMGDVVLSDASVNGCDSTVTVNLSFFPAATGQLDTTICATGTVDFNGEIFDATRPMGDVVLSDASVNGCDSTVTVNLSFFPAATGQLDTTICATGTVDFNGEIFDATRPMGDVVLSDASVNGCDSTVTVNLSFFPAATGQLDTTICATGNVDFNGEIFDATRPMGDVILSDASVNGCDSTVTVNLSFFPAATGQLDTTICATGTVDFNGEIFDATRPMGDVVLSDASVNGCDSTVTVNLSFFPAATGQLDTTICATGTVDFNGEIFDATRPMGDVVLSDASVNGCDSTVTVNLSFFPAATGQIDTTLCADGILSVGSEDFDATRPSGTATLTGMATNGCDSIITVNLSFFPAATGQFDTLLCPGENFILEGEVFDESRLQGDVLLNGASVNGCDSTVTVNLSYRQPASVDLIGQGQVCFDDLIDITLDNGSTETVTVQLAGAISPDLVVPPGSHNFQVDGVNGSTISIAAVMQASMSCPLSFSGSILIERSDIAIDLQSLSGSGGFDLSCADSNDGILQVDVTDGAMPYGYQWSVPGSGPTITDLGSGLVSVTVTDAFGCVQDANYTLEAPTPLSLELVDGIASCVDDLGVGQIQSITGGSGPYLYQAGNGGAFLPIDSLPFSISNVAGTYSLTIQDISGCEVSDNFTISPAPEPVLFIQPEDGIVRLGDSLLLNGQTNATVDSLFWSVEGQLIPGQNGLQLWASPTISSTYSLWLRDAAGCELESEVLVLVDRNVPVYTPTAFSPNGDGVNDLFLPLIGTGVQSLNDFQIFNRWGDVVHQIEGQLDLRSQAWAWDGNLGGQPLNPAVFVYSIRVTFLDGREEIVAGEVLLIR